MALAALGLGIGVLAALPANRPPRKTVPARSLARHPASPSTTTSSTSAAAAVRVVVLAPAGAPEQQSVTSRLEAAKDVVVPHAAIPSAWVSSLTSPIVRYPSGLEEAALAVAHTLGLGPSVVSAEPAGTSEGADVVEVFVPAS